MDRSPLTLFTTCGSGQIIINAIRRYVCIKCMALDYLERGHHGTHTHLCSREIKISVGVQEQWLIIIAADLTWLIINNNNLVPYIKHALYVACTVWVHMGGRLRDAAGDTLTNRESWWIITNILIRRLGMNSLLSQTPFCIQALRWATLRDY